MGSTDRLPGADRGRSAVFATADGTIGVHRPAGTSGSRTGQSGSRIEGALQKKPGHLPVLMRMAHLEHDQSKLAEAEAHLREALAAEAGNADVHLELGLVL